MQRDKRGEKTLEDRDLRSDLNNFSKCRNQSNMSEVIVKDIIKENFPELKKKKKTQLKMAYQGSGKINKKGSTINTNNC